MDISRIKLGGTDYTLKDAVARGEEEESEGISHIEIGGVSYDCKDVVARGEGEATAQEISKVSIGGKVYQIKDDEARAAKVYFAVYYAEDNSAVFYGDTEKPAVGSQYKGKTVTYVGEFEDTPIDQDPDFNENWYADVKTVYADESARGAKPKSFYNWFASSKNLVDCDLHNLDTSSVTTMSYMFCSCSSLTALDISNWDTSSVTTMYQMFRDCSNLTTVYSDDANFVTTKVTSGGSMFTNCTKLVGGNGTVYDSSKTGYTMAHVDKPDNEGYFTDIADKD